MARARHVTRGPVRTGPPLAPQGIEPVTGARLSTALPSPLAGPLGIVSDVWAGVGETAALSPVWGAPLP